MGQNVSISEFLTICEQQWVTVISECMGKTFQADSTFSMSAVLNVHVRRLFGLVSSVMLHKLTTQMSPLPQKKKERKKKHVNYCSPVNSIKKLLYCQYVSWTQCACEKAVWSCVICHIAQADNKQTNKEASKQTNKHTCKLLPPNKLYNEVTLLSVCQLNLMCMWEGCLVRCHLSCCTNWQPKHSFVTNKQTNM